MRSRLTKPHSNFSRTTKEIYLELGKVLGKEKKWEQAIAAYQRAIELNPDYLRSHKYLGDILAEGGQINEASLCYRRALQLQPKTC
ncbi:tetratricopeptide repeat protein [Coleofasciculus sp. H7-2]|uniref:tetratricopeptide repeat protein n=1 Tax=Coleofasciculus sp. H7-2 TaxID=3351545 RepID=UPI0036717A39